MRLKRATKPWKGTKSLTVVWLSWTLLLASCSSSDRPFVVVYTSQDQVYSEPILQAFTEQTGIEVRAVYDSEAVKTVGLANRLLAERAHPRCDLFWNNEELRTWQLAAQNVFAHTNDWPRIGYRSRRMVINTNRVSLEQAPVSLGELTNEVWRGKVALAYPLFGTTATHFLALRQHWGEERWRSWCQNLRNNDPFLVDGNSVVVQLVGRGEAWIGLTDSDDIAAGQRQGLPVRALPIWSESLLIPNTLAQVRGAPRPGHAERLVEFLQQPETVQRLAEARALEGISMSEIKTPTLQPNYKELVQELEDGIEELQSIFLR